MSEEILADPAIPGETRPRLAFASDTVELLHALWDRHGPLMFHQSGGCCDGSSPMCYPLGDFIIGGADVQLGTVDLGPAPGDLSGAHRTVPFYMSAEQFEYWKHTFLTIDVVDGRGSGFSVEAPEGKRFLTRSRLMDG
ncbi:DUF779 domain-containing protein [Leucobacter weissii]|uniref:DUF779 domain-containing protein n=1 Tax=Leucobacter weissii TaxID=1983706 RepID=A0A939MN77_9MICO|nr:DUF779 domain-containing protein [Leucobacter weissii]MBO1901907.1 DUF779 domain-containing protein [Leucobacter weissii]